jgi:hypothetical protein
LTASADTASQAALDLALWASIKDSVDPAMLEAYLGRFPGGTFAVVARLRLSELRGTRAAPATRSAVPPPPLSKPAAVPDLKPVEAPYVVLRDANVRAAPTTAATALDVLVAGTEVRVAGSTADGDWLAIKLPEGGLAYVHASLLQDKATWQSRTRRGRLDNSVALLRRYALR